MSLAIDARGLRKRFGTNIVLDGVDLAVARGEIFALLGPNGAGKTTAVHILTTLTKPDGGSALVAGHDVAASPTAVTQRIALTGQSAAVDEMLTAGENLVMFGRLSGLSRRAAAARAGDLLDRFDLAEATSRRVGTFSGGMRQRLDLALSFVTQPEVLFLDEPTTGLDTRSRRELWTIIASLAESGTTVFLTTQYLEEADQLADRIAVLHDGRIAALGTADDLKARVDGGSVELRDARGSVVHRVPTDGSVTSIRRAIEEIDRARLDGEVTITRPSLDDVFLALTDKEPA